MVNNNLCSKIFMLALIFSALSVISGQQAKSDEIEDYARAFGDESFLSIATGKRQPIDAAPAVASVITADDIRMMGATTLDDVLETVPGLHVVPSALGYLPRYTIRGIFSEYNPQVLFLINGIPITNAFLGNRGQAFLNVPVHTIQRIEVMRGPGSAIYGADAFAGVINIITRDADSIDKPEIGLRIGSFNSYQSWLLSSGNWAGWKSAFAIDLLATDGHKRKISSDQQSAFDALTGTSASFAPGSVHLGAETADARLDLQHGPWRIRAGLQITNNAESGVGGSQALDPVGQADSHRFNLDITHTDKISENWELVSQGSLFDTSVRSNLMLLPPGADFTGAPFFVANSSFPNGVLGNPDVYERHWRVSTTATYKGLPEHLLQVAAGYVVSDMYRIEESKNFTLNAIGIPVSLGGLVDVTDTAPFIRPKDRSIWFTWLQDEWGFAPDWKLTAGVRYDNYSDFGDTINPRLALVWNTNLVWTTKLLYGRAFRPPSFAEQFNINNPVAIGNPELDPETIDTLEVAFDYRPKPDLHMGFNVFTYKWKDIIRFVPDAAATTSTAQNTGEQDGYGFEYELLWKIARDFTLHGNYAWQRSTDRTTDSNAGYAPGHQLYVRGDWGFAPNWNLDTQINYVADRKRSSGDTRPNIDDYTTVDVTLRKNTKRGWSIAFSIKNLFDEDAREPSLAPGSIANDLPLAGRNASIEMQIPL